MNNNEQLFDLMSKMYGEMQEGFKEISGEMQKGFKQVNSRVDYVDGELKEVKEDVKELKEGQSRIENKLDDIEANNADRHISINGEIRKIKNTLSKVEMVTADNWSDIARIKATRRVK